MADIVEPVDHKHIVSPTASKELKITSRGMQRQIVVQCPNCGTDDVRKYGHYKNKQVSYFKCNRCKMHKTGRPFTFPVQMVWR